MIARPPDNTSRVAICFAPMTTLRNAGTRTYGNNATRLVSAAQKPSMVNTSSASCPPARNHRDEGAGCSVSATASNPAASAVRAKSATYTGLRISSLYVG